eukprot:5771266-Prymnesium_polylepis.1
MLLSETSQSQWISNTGPTPCRWDGTSGRKRHETGEADSCIPPPMPRVASGHRRVGASIGCVSIVAEHALERRLEWQVDALHREAEKLLQRRQAQPVRGGSEEAAAATSAARA